MNLATRVNHNITNLFQNIFYKFKSQNEYLFSSSQNEAQFHTDSSELKDIIIFLL